MVKKFNLDFLNKFCKEKSIILLKDYSENVLNSLTQIEFKCINCNEDTSKRFVYMIKYNPTCHRCSDIERVNKAKKTLLLKYGVENISQIEEVKNKKKETTLKNYGVVHNSQSQEIKDKKVQTCLTNFGVRYPQESKEIKNKSKITCLNNYKVEHPLQNEELKQKSIKTTIIKYGKEYASQTEDFKNKVKQTCLNKYGVEYLMQNKNFQNKSKETCFKNYGVEYASQSEEIKQKIKESNKIKYGVEHPTQCEEIKQKIKESNKIKYGVEHPTQCEEIMGKYSKNAYKLKVFKFKSGQEVICQGYEPFALNELNQDLDESNILTGSKNVPKIWYNDVSGKKHRHYVDIFILNQNRCIEVKSTWTFKKNEELVFLKQAAAKELGYLYEIWVYDKKGNKIECFK